MKLWGKLRKMGIISKKLLFGTEVPVQNKSRIRSNSAENWSGKEAHNSTKRSTMGGSVDRAKDERQRHKAVRQDSYLAAVKPVSINSGTFTFYPPSLKENVNAFYTCTILSILTPNSV